MAKRRDGMLALAIALLVLGGIYALFRPVKSVGDASPGSGPSPVASSVPSATVVPTAAAAVPDARSPTIVFKLVIADLKPGVETPVLKAKQGDTITLAITSTRTGTLEVHGYNQRVAIAPDAEATLAFQAERAGRFPIDLHGRDGKHVELTALEIMPQ
jgi:hypothetical protein